MKLNLGAGDCPLDDREWVNLDAKTRDSLFPLIKITGTDDHASAYEFLDGCADEVRASHVLEHFPHGQTLDVLKEWVRVLKPGGWLKIAVPDFDRIVIARDTREWDESLIQGYLMGGQVDGKDFHKAIFTVQKLKDLLSKCGLVNIQGWTSEIADCASLPVSLNLMGQKPEAAPETRRCLHGSIIGKGGGFCPVCLVELEQKPEVKEAKNDLAKCQSWGYSGDPFNPHSKGVQCSNPVADGKFCAKHAASPKMTTEDQAQVNKNLQALASAINDNSTFSAPKSSASRMQVFAAGRWQDLDGEVQCATQEELDAANRGELQMRTIVLGERRAARVALCLSTPRIGFLRPLERLLGVMHQAGVSVFSGDGVFWHHSLSRSIKNACDSYFMDSGEGFDFILTADYDTYALLEDLKAIIELLARNPQADCIVPVQMKRGGTGEILAGGSNMNLTQPLVPIETGHFGFTLFRKEFFEKLPTPWFYEKPDVDGHWGDGRIDADIGFWLNAKKAKLNVMLAPQIVVGHGEELITYPRIISGKPQKVYQAVNDWLNVQTKPEGIGAQI